MIGARNLLGLELKPVPIISKKPPASKAKPHHPDPAATDPDKKIDIYRLTSAGQVRTHYCTPAASDWRAPGQPGWR